MNYDLIIYIPTYNRAESLMKQLRNLSKCGKKDRIMVIVRDNCSTENAYVDGSIEQYRSNHGFNYLRNASNIGVNPNIIEGFMYSKKAKYLWVLSDDDLINENAADLTLDILDKYSPDILYYTHTGNDIGCLNKFNINMINNGLGLISCIIYKTEKIVDNIRAGYENLLSCFPHLAILLESQKVDNMSVYSVNKSTISINSQEEIIYPEGICGYRRSFYGFILLSNNIQVSKRRKFVRDWWSDYYNKFAAAKYKNNKMEQYILWKKTMKQNIKIFELRFFVIKIFLPIVEKLYVIRRKKLRR